MHSDGWTALHWAAYYGNRRMIRSLVDADADRLQVFMDGQMVLDDQSHDYVMTRPEGGGSGWLAGTSFDGQIAEIRLDDDIAPLPQQPVASDLTAFV